MILRLKNGIMRIADGNIGSQFSANVRVTLDNDLADDGYIASLLVKYQSEDGSVVERLCPMIDGAFAVPADAYKQTQVIMLTASNVRGDEVVNSHPLYVRIFEGNSGGSEVLPSDETTWQTLVKAYVDSLLTAQNEKIQQLDSRVTAVEQSGGGGGGGSSVTEATVSGWGFAKKTDIPVTAEDKAHLDTLWDDYRSALEVVG